MSKKKGQNSRRDDVKTEHPLQAILLADSFRNIFRPITFEKPKVLLPLVNVPMLEYPIEMLASSGVKEVIVFCVSQAEEIEEYLKTSRCSKIISLQCITSPSCTSAGDAIRELDRMHVIRSDPFILISGSIVSNMNLAKAIEEHQNRDKSTLMTTIFKKAHVNHPTKRLVGDLVVAMDKRTNQVIMYDDNDKSSSVHIPTIFLQEHSEISVRYDLLDCHIDICSPEVLVQFSDNFDYLDVRSDFVHNEVQNFELGHKIYAKIITDAYAAPVHDPRTYDAVSRDIIRRWTYPMVPDNNLLGSTCYTYQRGGIYKEEQVSLERSCVIGDHTVIGAGTSIQQNTHISSSVLGRNCRIGKDVQIKGCYLWDNVVIEDGVRLESSILCSGVIIRENAVVERGCMLSFGVIVGNGFTLPKFSRLTRAACPDDQEDEFHDKKSNTTTVVDKMRNESSSWDPNVVGVGGEGRIWQETSDDDIGPVEVRKMGIGSTEDEKDYEKRWDQWDNSSDDEENYAFETETLQEYFIRVVRDMVLSGDRQGHSVHHILLEIKSFKFAQNRNFSDCIYAILPALIDSVEKDNRPSMTLLKEILPKFESWGKPLTKWIMGESEEWAVIQSIASHVTEPSNKHVFFPLFRYFLQFVYDLELASEETILSWSKSADSPAMKELIDNPDVQEFMEWLQCEDEDSEDSSDGTDSS